MWFRITFYHLSYKERTKLWFARLSLGNTPLHPHPPSLPHSELCFPAQAGPRVSYGRSELTLRAHLQRFRDNTSGAQPGHWDFLNLPSDSDVQPETRTTASYVKMCFSISFQFGSEHPVFSFIRALKLPICKT